jgi:phage FluMu protein gp41
VEVAVSVVKDTLTDGLRWKGKTYKAVELRKPTVDDLEAAHDTEGADSNNITLNVAMLERVTTFSEFEGSVTTEMLRALSARDFRKLTALMDKADGLRFDSEDVSTDPT